MLLYLLLWFKKECDIWICESDSNGKPFARGRQTRYVTLCMTFVFLFYHAINGWIQNGWIQNGKIQNSWIQNDWILENSAILNSAIFLTCRILKI